MGEPEERRLRVVRHGEEPVFLDRREPCALERELAARARFDGESTWHTLTLTLSMGTIGALASGWQGATPVAIFFTLYAAITLLRSARR